LEVEFRETVPSGATFKAAAWPHPLESDVKIPGARPKIVNGVAWLDPPGAFTTTVAVETEAGFVPIKEGTCALIWLGETNDNGADKPFTVTEVPPIIIGSGEPPADCVTAARLDPNMDINDPGATGSEYDAAFTPPVTTGTVPVCENAPIETKRNMQPICRTFAGE